MRLLDKITARKIRDGDVQTFEALVNKHKNTVFNYCLRVVDNYHLAEELTQEVLIKVYQNIASYDSKKASLATWIFTIAHNTCINSLRNSHREVPACEIAIASELNSPEVKYVAKENLERLIGTIQCLTPEERSLVIFKDYLGFKYREVGGIFNIPVGTVKSRLFNIRTKIRGLMGDFYDYEFEKIILGFVNNLYYFGCLYSGRGLYAPVDRAYRNCTCGIGSTVYYDVLV